MKTKAAVIIQTAFRAFQCDTSDKVTKAVCKEAYAGGQVEDNKNSERKNEVGLDNKKKEGRNIVVEQLPSYLDC